jgi:predicted Zn-dependent protease
MTHLFRTIATLFNQRSSKAGNLNAHINKSLLLFALALTSTPLVGNAQANNPLPDFATFSTNAAQEYAIGRQFLRELRATTPVLSDPLLNSYLENLSYKLAFAAQSKHQQLQLVLLPDRNINAFAVMGGVIGVNAGLILHADNEAEIAAVLAHELAHIDQHHYARTSQDHSNDNMLYLAALLASIALASASNSDAGLALGLSTQAAMIDKHLSHSRLHEREADHIGMQTLVAANFNPQAMADFFVKMDKQSRILGLMPEFLLTHPLSQERIADSTLRARQLPQTGELNSLDYLLIRTRLLAIINSKDTSNISLLQKQLQEQPNNEVNRLALAFALLNADEYQAARAEVNTLRQQAPQRIDYVIAQADIELADNQPKIALDVLQQALLLNPNNDALRFYAASAAIKTQQYPLALTWLTPLSFERPEDPNVWHKLIEVYQAQKAGVDLLRARAEYSFLVGNIDKALKDLEQAKRLAQNNYPLLAKINVRFLTLTELKANTKKLR